MSARLRVAAAMLLVGALAAACSQAGSDIAVVPPAHGSDDSPANATANTTRLAGGDELLDAIAITQAVYPATIANENVPGAVILAPLDDVAMQVTAVQITHHPINAPVLFATEDGIPEPVLTELRRLVPDGVAMDANRQIYVVGDLDLAADQARDLGYRVRHFDGTDPARVARRIDDWKSTLEGDHEPLTVIGQLDRPELVVPVASFYAHAAISLAWVEGDLIPDATREMLRQRGGDAFLYLAGSTEVIDEDVATEMRQYGHVQRLDASDAVSMGVRNADYGDISRGFSWDIGEPGHNYAFAVVPDGGPVPPAAVTATVLSHLGKHGPLLVVESERVPTDVRRFLEERRPAYVAPNEALYNHGWIIGGTDTISLGVQAELDRLLAMQREPPTDR